MTKKTHARHLVPVMTGQQAVVLTREAWVTLLTYLKNKIDTEPTPEDIRRISFCVAIETDNTSMFIKEDP